MRLWFGVMVYKLVKQIIIFILFFIRWSILNSIYFVVIFLITFCHSFTQVAKIQQIGNNNKLLLKSELKSLLPLSKSGKWLITLISQLWELADFCRNPNLTSNSPFHDLYQDHTCFYFNINCLFYEIKHCQPTIIINVF